MFKLKQKTTITIKTYLKIFDLMKKDLEKKWAEEDKVACLQIAIQACKLLHDSSNAVKSCFICVEISGIKIRICDRNR